MTQKLLACGCLAAMLTAAAAPALADSGGAQPGASLRNEAPAAPPATAPQPPDGSALQGVVKPPPVGDAINKGVPPLGEFPMPVIPPPGTPGGDPKVVPK
jgi:hypothetical protein